MPPIYLDTNATTPVDERVLERMLPFLRRDFGNPSSAHRYGRAARDAIERARAQTAQLVGCEPDEVVFTGGGSEASNHVVRGVWEEADGSPHIVTTAVEHPATLEPIRAAARRGVAVTIVPVDETGRVDPDAVLEAVRPDTVLVSIMHANNEVGTIQPIADIGRRLAGTRVRFHIDAAQSAGKIPVDAETLGVHAITIAGHKLYAPKGVGALILRRDVALPPFIRGAGHEGGRRAGTENVPGIVGLGAACELARRELAARSAHMKAMRDALWSRLEAGIPGIRRLGHPEHVLPNTLAVLVPDVSARALLDRLDETVAASAGSACHDGTEEGSSVLRAMGVSDERARGMVRLSTGRGTTDADVAEAAEAIVREARALRRVAEPPPS